MHGLTLSDSMFKDESLRVSKRKHQIQHYQIVVIFVVYSDEFHLCRTVRAPHLLHSLQVI